MNSIYWGYSWDTVYLYQLCYAIPKLQRQQPQGLITIPHKQSRPCVFLSSLIVSKEERSMLYAEMKLILLVVETWARDAMEYLLKYQLQSDKISFQHSSQKQALDTDAKRLKEKVC